LRAAVKVAYDGRPFRGYQVQPDARTVQGEIRRALAKSGAAPDPSAARFQSASRTDAGVSALGNVIAFDTDLPRRGLLPALNAASKDVWFLGVAEVPDDFNPRHARRRWYRYHLIGDYDIEGLEKAARLFVGEHDFSSFAKDAPKPAIVALDAVTVVEVDGAAGLDFIAQRFLWRMVMRIVAAILSVVRGEASREEIASALHGGPAAFGLAPAGPLFLMDVDHGITYEMDQDSARLLLERLKKRKGDLAISDRFTHGVEEAVRG
jgi:tRNA pseudouridine38-40 synthase